MTTIIAWYLSLTLSAAADSTYPQEEKESTLRIDAVKGFVALGVKGDTKGLEDAFPPKSFFEETFAKAGKEVPADLEDKIREHRVALAKKVAESFKGKELATLELKDLGLSKFSQNEKNEVAKMNVGDCYGDVEAIQGDKKHNFRLFRYKKVFYFVDFP